MADGLDFSAGGTPVDAPDFSAGGRRAAAPDFSSGGTLAPDASAQMAARAQHSTLGDIGRSALGALETGAGEGLQGIGDVVHWGGASNLGKRIQGAGATEQANVSPQFAETTSKPILSKEGFNLTNIASKGINTVAGMAPQIAGTALASLAGPEVGIPVGAALFGTQGEAGGRNAGEQQVATLSDADLAKVPVYQQAIAAGATPDQARAQLSERAANRGAWTSGLFGAGLGLVGEIPGVGAIGDFAAKKLARGVGRVAGADTALASRGAARVVGKGIGEGIGFGGINAAGQVASNVANPVPTPTFENVGEAAAGGLLPGFALGAGRAGLARLMRPAGPLGRAAQTAQQTGAAAPDAGVPTGEPAPAAAGAPTEPQPPLTRKMPPPPVPWVNAETGEQRTPTATEVIAAFHRMQDDQAQADANNVKLVTGLSQLSDAWGVPLERLKSLRKVALNERQKGTTTADAEQRAAEDVAQQQATDARQQADRDLFANQKTANAGEEAPASAPAANAPAEAASGIPFMITNAMRADLGARGYDDAAIARMKPEEAQTILAKPIENTAAEQATPPPPETAATQPPVTEPPEAVATPPVAGEGGAAPIGNAEDTAAKAAGEAAMKAKDANSAPPQPVVSINRDHSVPLGGGWSTDHKTVYLDHNLPKELPVKRPDGSIVKVNTDDIATAHEAPEGPQMWQRGKSYAAAHNENANTYEDAFYQKKYGVSRAAVDKSLKPFLDQAREQRGQGATIPPDLDRTPYEDDGVTHLLDQKPTETATPDSVPRARPTGFPSGGWYALDEQGDMINPKPGTMPPRFKSAEAADRYARRARPTPETTVPQNKTPDVEAAAAESAVHPENPTPAPTPAQHVAGNFKSGHVNLHGLDVTIQVPKGGLRHGTNTAGKPWEREASAHYGHIRGTEGADREPVDVYLGPHAEAPKANVFVIDQMKPGTKTFDEHKAMIGFASGREARAAYDANFPKGVKTFGGIRKMSMDDFKDWVKSGHTTKPVAKARVEAAVAPTATAGKIEDIGEKIGGARKDTAVKTGRTARAKPSAEDAQPTWAKRYQISQIVKSMDAAENGRWAIHDLRQTRGGFPRAATRTTFATREEAEAAIPLIAVARNHGVTKRSDGNYGIYRKVTDRKRVVLKDGFPTPEDAKRFMAMHARDLIEQKTSVGEEALPKPETVTREGPTHRKGDVQPEEFRNTFGFRGVEFGNWNNQTERQEVMNHAYDGLHDLSELLKIPPKAISLNGELGLAFGARGHGLTGARAHYERDRVVMNLTKMQGAGALAHEWFHALDHYLSREGGTTSKEWKTLPDGTRVLKASGDATRYMASYSADKANALREDLRQAYTTLINTMQRTATTFVRDTAKIERFVGHTRSELETRLAKLRDYLAKETQYGSQHKRKPASPEQMAEFDTIAQRLVSGENLELEMRANKAAPGRRLASSYRRTNDDLERLSAILKAVRGHGGFTADGRSVMNEIGNIMTRYRTRLMEAADARAKPEAETTKPTSFRMEAVKADQGRGTNYWSTHHEMAARAFSSYIEDKLTAGKRSSDFLSYGSNERFVLPIPELPHPFPGGEERAAIDKAFDTFFATVKHEETEGGNVRLFSRTSLGETGGVAREQVQKLVDRTTAKWGDNQPRVRVVSDAEGLPASAKADAEGHPDDTYRTAEGYYDPKTGTAYLVAKNLKNPRRAMEVLAHEAVGHHGIENVVDDAFGAGAMKKIVDGIQRLDTQGNPSDTMRGLLQETHRRYDKAGEPADPLTFAKEFLAVSAEKGIRNTFLDRAVAAIRKFLRQIMPGLSINERDLRALLGHADRFVRESTPYRERVAQKAALAFSNKPDTFYSALRESVEAGNGAPKKADAVAWKQWLDGAQRRGEFKGAEREWMGLDQWLDSRQGPVTRAELIDHVRQNEVRVQEVMHRDEVPANEGADLRENEDGGFDLVDDQGAGAGSTKFGEYTLPGGKNYRELLMTLPSDTAKEDHGTAYYRETTDDFKSNHFDEPNILAHVRMDDRTGPDGEKILHVEEVQSDWHQAGRKTGYRGSAEERPPLPKGWVVKAPDANHSQWRMLADAADEKSWQFRAPSEAELWKAADTHLRKVDARPHLGGRVPDAPFKKEWPLLAMKRVLRYAAEHGYDKVTWTTGEQQEHRYWRQDSITPAIARWNDVTKPESVRELAENILGAKMARMMPLDKVDAGVLAVLKHNQVRRNVVSRIPVDVVNILADHGFRPEQLLRQSDMVLDRLPADARDRTLSGLSAAFRETGAALRTKLEGLKPGGSDVTLLPALRASDLTAREVVGIVSPSTIFDAGSGAAPEKTTATGASTKTLSGQERGISAPQLRSANLAELINAHATLSGGHEGILTQGVQPPPGEGMRAFYDKMLPNELNKYVKQWGAKVRESNIDTQGTGLAERREYVGEALTPDRVREIAADQPAMVERQLREVAGLMDSGHSLRDAMAEHGSISGARALGGELIARKTVPITVHSIDITPAMREGVMQGQPLFARPEPPSLFKPNESEADHFRAALRETMATRRTMVKPIRIGETSPVLRALGAKDLPIEISRDTVRKATNGVKHVVPMAVIERLPEELHDPLAVFKSRTHEGSLVALTELRDAKGSPVVVALDLRAMGDKYQVNRIASVYGKDGNRPLEMWVKDGMLAYKSNRAERSPVLDGLQLPNRMTGDFGQGKVLTEADVESRFGQPPNTRGAFSKPEPASAEDPADPSREPGRALDAQANVLREGEPGLMKKAREWVSGKWEDVRPFALGALQTGNVIELMRDKGPFKGTVDRYERSGEQLDADRNILLLGDPHAKEHPNDMLMKGAEPISTELQRFAYGSAWKMLGSKFTPEAKRTFDVMHGATIAGVDPAKPYERLTIRNARGERVPWTSENRAERIKLNKELALERGGDPMATRESLADEQKYLRSLPRLEERQKADYARLKKQFDALPEEGKRMYRQTRDWYARYSEETEKALIKNIEALDMPETYRRSLVNRMRLQFEDARAEGVYFPLNRNGDYWVAYRTPEGRNGFEMFEKFNDARKRERELKASGNRIDATGRRDPNAKAKDAPSGTFVRTIIDDLAKHNVSEKTQDLVYQAYLRTMPEMSMRKHSVHRGKVVGYDQNVPRTFAKFSFHGAYQLAKLRHAQDMQFALDALSKSLDIWRRGNDKFPGANAGELEKFMEGALGRYEANPDAEQAAAAKVDAGGLAMALDELAEKVASTRQGLKSKVEREAWNGLAQRWRELPKEVRRAYTLDAAEKFGLHEPKSAKDIAKMDALLGELRKRYDWTMNPTDQQIANTVNSIGFIWYLGASPASALTNLTQIAQTALPYLGARHGWGKASRMLAAAWHDAARTGGNMERLLKTDDDRRAFLEMQQRGIFSRTRAHTQAGLAEGNMLQANPGWARIMNGISWMFHKSELVNRQATGMAAFRLARAEGKSFDEAMEYAMRVNKDTNFDYSAANRQRWAQGNIPRIAMQFKNYSASMTWMYWRNFHQAFKGETPEIRRVAAKTLAGITGMTALLAGATGLPIYNVVRNTANAANAVFGNDDEPFDFDDAFHRWLADNLGPDAARLIAEGPTNYVTGANIASRTSMSNLWIRNDDQNLHGADAFYSYLAAVAGPMGGVGKNIFVGSDEIRRGYLERGIETMLPTSVKNSIKAIRYAHEGVNSLRGDPIVPDVSTPEEFLQAIGFEPSKIAEQYRVNSAMKNYTSEIQDRRSNVMNAYALAVKSGDTDDRSSAIAAISRFNQAHPQVAITLKTLHASLMQRARLSAQARNGVVLNRRLALQAQQYAGVQ